MSDCVLAMGKKVYRTAERLFKKRQVDGPTLVLGGGKRFSELPEGLLFAAGRKMISVVLSAFFRMQSRNGIGYEINIDHIHTVARAKRQHG